MPFLIMQAAEQEAQLNAPHRKRVVSQSPLLPALWYRFVAAVFPLQAFAQQDTISTSGDRFRLLQALQSMDCSTLVVSSDRDLLSLLMLRQLSVHSDSQLTLITNSGNF